MLLNGHTFGHLPNSACGVKFRVGRPDVSVIAGGQTVQCLGSTNNELNLPVFTDSALLRLAHMPSVYMLLNVAPSHAPMVITSAVSVESAWVV